MGNPMPGVFPSMFPFAGGTQATRHARRVYVGGLPPMANEQSVATFFSQVMAAVGANTAGPGTLETYGSMFTIGVFIACILLILVEFDCQLLDHSCNGNFLLELAVFGGCQSSHRTNCCMRNTYVNFEIPALRKTLLLIVGVLVEPGLFTVTMLPV
jgi:hypothetical protein